MPAFACSGKRQQESRHKEVADSDASITWKNKSAAPDTTPIMCNDNRLIPGEPRYLMKKICLFANGLILATATATAQGASMQLTLDMPDCRMPPGKPLPDKYQALARKEKEFAWVRDAKPGDHAVNGNGWERIDGASNHTWIAFSKIDLDNDGMCDWYLHAASALSSGGDRDSINTLYLGRKNGWLRVGATVPANKPDELASAIPMRNNRGICLGKTFLLSMTLPREPTISLLPFTAAMSAIPPCLATGSWCGMKISEVCSCWTNGSRNPEQPRSMLSSKRMARADLR